MLGLTDKGKKAIPGSKIKKAFHKQGSWEYEYWKYRIGEHYRKKGYKITYEYKIDKGKSVDIVDKKDGRRIAQEIETGTSDAIYNNRKNIQSGFNKIITVTINDAIYDDIKKILKNPD